MHMNIPISNLLSAELADMLTGKEKLRFFCVCVSNALPPTIDRINTVKNCNKNSVGRMRKLRTLNLKMTCLGTWYPTIHIFRHLKCKIGEKYPLGVA